MRLKKHVLFAAIFYLAAAALAQFQFGTSGPSFRTLAQGQNSTATGFRTEILNMEGDLQRWWTKVVGSRPESAPRGIEWGREMVVAINLGQRPTAGYSVYVETIAKRMGQLLVSVVELKPAPGTMQAQMITSPWVLIRMDRQAEPLVFQRSERIGVTVINKPSAPCGCTCGCPFCARGQRWGGH